MRSPPCPLSRARVASCAIALLQRHPGAALPAEELLRRLQLEGLGDDLTPESLVGQLGPELHVLAPARPPLPGYAPTTWVLVPPGAPADETDPDAGVMEGERHPLLLLLRHSIRRLGLAVFPESTREMARWERLQEEEAGLRKALGRRLRALRRRRSATGNALRTPVARDPRRRAPA